MLLQAGYILNTISTTKLLLIGNPSTIDIQDEQGATALHYAVRNHVVYSRKNSGIAKVLCENGADASLRGSNGQTPLHCVVFKTFTHEPTDTALIDILLEKGASLGDTDVEDNNPLHHAPRNLSQIEVVRVFLS